MRAFIHQKRIAIVLLVVAAILSVVAVTAFDNARAHSISLNPVALSGFTITSPMAGSLVPCGQPVTVTWTGGNPSDMVNVVLIDVQNFQVYQGFGVESNTGSRVVTIGPGSCGRQSQFYVEDSPRTTWTYGPAFMVGNAPTPTPTPTPACGGITYNVVSDFSATSNPNGPWSYGWESTLGGAFTLFASERTVYAGLDTWEGPDGIFGGYFPLVSRNHTGATLNYGETVSHPANMLNVNPSFSGKLSVIRWTAPTTGAFSVTGLFQGIDTQSTMTNVHIRQNGSTALFDGIINGSGVEAPFNLILNVAAGDTLDFAVGLDSFFKGPTGLAATITEACPTPTPAPTPTPLTCTAPPSNMVSWWPGDGNARDIQGGNNGALRGVATFGPGKVGQAFSFNGGLNDFVDVPFNANLNLTQALTIDAWVNPSGVNQHGGIVETGGLNAQYSLHIESGRMLFRLIKVPGVDHRTIQSDSIIPTNTWTHVAGTWDGVTMKLFINGVQQAQTLSVSPPINSGGGTTQIGYTDVNPYAGLIDEVEIFNRALSVQEILAIYQADSAGKCKPDSDGDGISDATDNCVNIVNSDQADSDNDGVGNVCEVSPTCTTPPSNMVSWWPGDGNANDIQDDNNGTLQNGATFGTGMVAQAFSLDGADDFVEVPYNSNLDLTRAMTIDAWVNPSTVSQDRSIVEKTVGGGVNTQYLLYLQGGSVVFRLIKVPGVAHATIVSDSLVPVNTWTHVAGTWDGVTMKLFVNGVQQSRTFDLEPPINGGVGPTLIGKAGSNISHFGGLIDEVEIFSRALSGDEIRAIYLANTAGKCKPSGCATTYDAVRDFSITSNPNGTWSYGWEASLGGVFTTYGLVNSAFTPGIDYWVGTENNCGQPNFPLVAFNHTGSTLNHSSGVSHPANMLSLHPSCTGKPSVVRWSAPTTGSFDIVGLFQGIDTRNTTSDVHVLQNSTTSLFSANINGFGNQAPFSFTRYLTAGETLDFVVGWGTNSNYGADSTGLAVMISGGAANTLAISCPQPVTASANSDCQAPVPDVLDGVTASECGGPVTLSQSPTAGTLVGVGTTTITVTATDAANNSSSCTTTFTVTDNTPPTINPMSNIATATDSNDCTARVNFAPTVSDNCSGVSFSCSTPSGSAFPLGTTNVTCTATDASGNTAATSFNVTVTDNTPPTISPMSNITTTTDPGECTARVNFSPTVADNCSGVSFSCSSPSGSAFPIGTTGVTCTATDVSGNTAATSFTITVNNSAPTVSINSPASGAIFTAGTNVNFAGSFADNAGDLHTAQWSFVSGSQNISQAGTVNEGAATADANYSFTTTGVYLVTLTIADQCGHSATTNVVSPDGLTAMVVVYDPDAGSVTGGGWFDSPAGALIANPSLIGRANFGFTSRYHHGANVPDGQTEFQFKTGNLNFHSTNYEWLVVAGAKAQFKGNGTINGTGAYDFMLTVIDGDINGGSGLDKFRIRIWDRSSGGLVYDNKVGGGLNDDPTTVIRGGSIVIHRN